MFAKGQTQERHKAAPGTYINKSKIMLLKS